MSSTIDFFNAFLDEVKLTDEWKQMENTVEGTGWHREANVAVHTLMTIDYFLANFAPARTERQQMLGLMALLFHDFGKPAAEITVVKDGVSRHQYIGHERVSAMSMRNFFEKHDHLRNAWFGQGYQQRDVDILYFLIDHHLPYGLSKKKKVEALHEKIDSFLGEDAEVFYDVLRSDSNGRISDAHEEKLYKVEEWITKFKSAKSLAC